MLTLLESPSGLFEILDANHDGALSIRELRVALPRVREAGCLVNGAYDSSKTPRVFLAAASRGYPKSFGIEPSRGPAWFRTMDRNNDGDVSRGEWIGDAALFHRLDRDGDGLLSPEEAEKAASKN